MRLRAGASVARSMASDWSLLNSMAGFDPLASLGPIEGSDVSLLSSPGGFESRWGDPISGVIQGMTAPVKRLSEGSSPSAPTTSHRVRMRRGSPKPAKAVRLRPVVLKRRSFLRLRHWNVSSRCAMAYDRVRSCHGGYEPVSAQESSWVDTTVGDAEIEQLVAVLRGRRITALTGAGCSTESGIPDYRGPETRRRARNPVQYRDFVRDPSARRRYWARSMVGWPRIADARPNPAHRALADMERDGVLVGLITQNVDRLHQAAGSTRVIELHGALAEVLCWDCGARESRASVQARLLSLNPNLGDSSAELAPDGDAELVGESTAGFCVPGCMVCGGVLKPDVVFFGESVPRDVVSAAKELVRSADALLIVGSSLAVFSGYRFVRVAVEHGIPIAIVNIGATRGDPHASVRVHGRAGQVLPRMSRGLAQ